MPDWTFMTIYFIHHWLMFAFVAGLVLYPVGRILSRMGFDVLVDFRSNPADESDSFVGCRIHRLAATEHLDEFLKPDRFVGLGKVFEMAVCHIANPAAPHTPSVLQCMRF